MAYWKWGFVAVLLVIGTLVVIEDSAKKDAKRKAASLTPELVKAHACADRLLSTHLEESAKLLEKQMATTRAGGNEIAAIQAVQREKELHCTRYVECYTPPEMLRGAMYEDCLKDPI